MRWLSSDAPAIKRLYAGTVIGAAIVVAVAVFAPWQADVLAFWDGLAVTFLAAVWYQIRPLDGRETAAAAVREDDTRTMTDLVLLTAATVSLVGVALALVKATDEGGRTEFVLTVLAVLTIILSWGVIHTAYTLRYAHLFYSPPTGGVDFHETDPDYQDFAYLAVTIGMTFQVSDTDISKRAIRRAATSHAMLSYVFSVVIIAATVNVVAGFLH
jgi:uncharacterized membrane protein